MQAPRGSLVISIVPMCKSKSFRLCAGVSLFGQVDRDFWKSVVAPRVGTGAVLVYSRARHVCRGIRAGIVVARLRGF